MGIVITVGMEKGGPGKTTIATNLAVTCVIAGMRVLLVDADKQRTTATWAEGRRDKGIEPPITCVEKTGKCGRDIAELAENYDVVIVDAGGHDSIELRQAFAVADLCIMPLRPCQPDVWTLPAMIKLLDEIEERTGTRPQVRILINGKEAPKKVRGEYRETKDTRDTVDLIDKSFGGSMPVLKSMVSYRPAFWRAFPEGMSVIEMPKTARAESAKEEISNVFSEIFNVELASVDQSAAA
ncbi:partition protein [Caballeronia pedi]|uniref:Partition protein n=1 Tax=Caballeronia pedi TaxID=1777141 RepID=A0A158E415_9BURK|nr:AAA family ATPase [Caballeronia pedi]SAL01641.1 partition protein [Caballeronia pedi]